MDQQDNEIQAKRRLGRGLNALLGTASSMSDETANADPTQDASLIHVELIEKNPFQPRQEFDQEGMNELVDSIKTHGLLQPLLVRPHGDTYQLIAGERRWLACKRAGLELVACRVLELDDQKVCEVAIEENLKRKDLNALEKAQAFHDYMERFGASIEQLARRLSVDRSTLSNMLRLLELAPSVQQAVRTSQISPGHARALLKLDHAQQEELCTRLLKESLSVRQVEAAVRGLTQPAESAGDDPQTVPFTPGKKVGEVDEHMTNHVLSLQDQLRDLLGAKVEIKLKGKDSGKIIIQFDTNDQFEGIVSHLRRAA